MRYYRPNLITQSVFTNLLYNFYISLTTGLWLQVYETLTGVKVEGKPPLLSKEDVLHSLPAEWPEDPMDDLVSVASRNSKKILVVLDDDPTGTQTVHDIEVLTEW